MARVNSNGTAIRNVALVGDNRISSAINHTLSSDEGTYIHQIVPKQSSASAALNLSIHKSDFSRASLRKFFSTIQPDVVISTMAGGSYDAQKVVIDAAVEAGVLRFIPAEFGQDSMNSKIQDRLPPWHERARTIAYLRETADSKSISWVAAATGCPLDHGLESGNIGFDIKWQSATMHGTGEEYFAASSVNWVGVVVRAILQHWDTVANRYLYAAGTITSANEILDCLESLSGQQWEAGRGDVVDCVQEAERRIARGFPDAGMFLMERSVLYDEALGATRPFVDNDAKDLLGLQGERVHDIVRAVLHEHTHHSEGDCGCG